MFEKIKEMKNIKEFFNQSKIKIKNYKLCKAVQDYSLIYFTDNVDFNQFPNIINNICESKVIVINHYPKSLLNEEDIHFIICFKKTIIFVAKQFLSNPNNYSDIDHINHDKSDYHLENLRFVSHSSNCFNKSSTKGIQYEFIDDLPEEAIKILFYDTKVKHYEFEDNKYYYYHDDENNEDIFYGRITNNLYRKLYINIDKSGNRFIMMKDANNANVSMMLKRFKYNYALD